MTSSALGRAMVAVVFAASLARAQGAPVAAHARCDFRPAATRWKGTCGRMFEQTPVFTIAPARAIKTGMWRKDAAPREVWAGTMTDSGYPDADVEVEIYEKGEGVLRTAYGWFAISKFAHDAQGTRFEVDTLDEVPPNALDRAIIERAGVRTSIG